MFSFKNYLPATSLEEAYQELQKNRKNIILGGTSYLRMGSISYNTGIDISNLDLSYIRKENDDICIGATTTFRDLEVSPITKTKFDGILDICVRGILGVQFRSNVQIGATVFSKYGFSDLIPTLLAMNARVILYKRGEITLEDYLKEDGLTRDILVEIRIKDIDGSRGSFQSIRKSKTDYAITNACVTKIDGKYRVVVGVRPGKAMVVTKITEILNETKKVDENLINEAISKLDEEITFGRNMRGTAEYRKMVSKILIKRAIMEVL